MTDSSIRKNQALKNLNDKILRILKDRGIIATYLLSPLSKITNQENTSQVNLVKGSNSNRINDLLVVYKTEYDNKDAGHTL